MGCDIHTVTEQLINGEWIPVDFGKTVEEYGSWKREIFEGRNYGKFGFLADVRNYSHVPAQWPNRGWPDNASQEARDMWEKVYDWCGHSQTYVTLKELLAFDYDATFEDRRTTVTTIFPGGGSFTDGAAEAEPGKGKIVTFREFLGTAFFDDIETLVKLENDDVRVLICFNN